MRTLIPVWKDPELVRVERTNTYLPIDAVKGVVLFGSKLPKGISCMMLDADATDLIYTRRAYVEEAFTVIRDTALLNEEDNPPKSLG